MLNMINRTQLQIDGDFGAKTLAAVVSFQKKYKLKTDGIVGNMTYAKLVEVNRRKMNKGKGKYNIE
jgi:peptidoglycan hydrolase-like protein with peptidoglycan-binding domain